jgi:hypothetical protein
VVNGASNTVTGTIAPPADSNAAVLAVNSAADRLYL